MARVLTAADQSRSILSSGDPEVGLLKTVGPGNAAILIEPLICDRMVVCGSYLTMALKGLVDESHKGLIIDNLSAAPALAEVVADRGWEADASQVLRDGLSRPTWQIGVVWICLAARVATPKQYPLLRAHFRSAAGNRYPIWKAISRIDGVGPLQGIVDDLWSETVREGAKGYFKVDAALVAAHYGHLDALEVVAHAMLSNLEPAWETFSQLTGFGPDMGLFSDREQKGWAWFQSVRGRLRFDRKTGRYVVSSG